MLTWKEYTIQPHGQAPKGLDSYGATVFGPLGAMLFFNITRTSRRYPQFRPAFAKMDGYILSLNVHDVFSGTLEECQAEAEKRANRFMEEFGGRWSEELLTPVKN